METGLLYLMIPPPCSGQSVRTSFLRRSCMKISRSKVRGALWSAAVVCLVAGFGAYRISAQQKGTTAPSFPGYITGAVQGEKGPEAGVWVIAETKDLMTGFIKIVVTDDRGRFMLPDLPAASYKVWTRGYGIVDSAPITMNPATNQITIKAVSAKTPHEAAKAYPANDR